MYIANVTNGYDNTTSSNFKDYDNITDTNICTENFDKIIPFLLIIPCGLSFLCLLSLMVYTIIKLLFKNK